MQEEGDFRSTKANGVLSGGETDQKVQRGVVLDMEKIAHAAAHPPECINDRLLKTYFRLCGRQSMNVMFEV